MKKKHLLSTILLLIAIGSFAQTTYKVEYTYDEAGNRKSRQLIVVTLRPVAKQTSSPEPEPVEAPIGERKVIIYPNPTKGDLAIEVSGGDAKDKIDILLYDSQGRCLQNLKGMVGKTPVDMNAYPATWYIMRVKAGDKVTDFKVIKE